MTPVFSVAIPAYNSGHLIRETLDAILNQTFPPAEVVVVDDGSTDDTSTILQRYAGRIHSVRINNSGPGIARKTAIELCASDWIALCDSDDVWNADYLARKARLIERFPDINLMFANFASFGPNTLPGHTHQPPDGWLAAFTESQDGDFVLLHDPYRALLRFNVAYPSGTAFTMELYQKIGGINPKYSRRVAEDADLSYRLALHGDARAGYDQHLCWNYRRHHSNFSTSTAYKNTWGGALILEDHLNIGIIPTPLAREVAERITQRKKTAFQEAYWSGQYADALNIYPSLSSHTKNLKLRLQALFCQLRGKIRFARHGVAESTTMKR